MNLPLKAGWAGHPIDLHVAEECISQFRLFCFMAEESMTRQEKIIEPCGKGSKPDIRISVPTGTDWLGCSPLPNLVFRHMLIWCYSIESLKEAYSVRKEIDVSIRGNRLWLPTSQSVGAGLLFDFGTVWMVLFEVIYLRSPSRLSFPPLQLKAKRLYPLLIVISSSWLQSTTKDDPQVSPENLSCRIVVKRYTQFC